VTSVPTPSDTTLRDHNADGTPRDDPGTPENGEPVNPATGEFFIDEVDLTFPGFGVTFSHRRTYRSRIDYEGVLGHGWDHGYNQRLLRVRRARGGSRSRGGSRLGSYRRIAFQRHAGRRRADGAHRSARGCARRRLVLWPRASLHDRARHDAQVP
jgi:hypothetical protein